MEDTEDNHQVLHDSIATESVDLIYLDPPFNSNATYNVGLLGESGHDRMRGRTAACSQDRMLAAILEFLPTPSLATMALLDRPGGSAYREGVLRC